MTQILPIIIGVAALIIGILLGKFLFAKNAKKQVEEAEQLAQKIISDAKTQGETQKKERILEAKEQFVQLKADHDREIFQRNQKLSDAENRHKQKEQSVNQKEQNIAKIIKENEVIKENLTRQTEVVNIKRTELEKHQEENIHFLIKLMQCRFILFFFLF